MESTKGNDRFEAGTWLLDAWMESQLGSTKGHSGAHMTDKVRLTAEQASWPPATVFFNYFYHGVKNLKGEVKFENGVAEGHYQQPGVDDIAAQVVTISGSYDAASFHIRFAQQVFGMAFEQIVEGRLAEPEA